MAERDIVIIGGGIIGCTTAYYLAHHPSFSSETTQITLLEASAKGIAQGASGKAGGLIAKWAYPKELVNVSFPEHVRLAQLHGGAERWGWRFVECGSWEGRGEIYPAGGSQNDNSVGTEPRSLEKKVGLEDGWSQKSRADIGLPEDLHWVREDLTDAYSSMAPSGATAQIYPYPFTANMLEFAKEKGVKSLTGKAIEICIDESIKCVTGVTYSVPGSSEPDVTIPATHVILAAGVWSPKLIPSLPITGTRAHSITILPKPSVTISPYALFTEITLPSASSSSTQNVSPEIYARPNNEVYCCGRGDNSHVPDSVDEVQVDQAACDRIHEHVSSISTELREGTVGRRQACFLPVVSSGGGAIIGEAASIAKGLIVATGHTCWGICNAPGTAKAVAELVMEGKIKCANLKALSPSKHIPSSTLQSVFE